MNDKLDRALGLLRRVCASICKRPNELRMEAEESDGTLEITIEANPADTRRLVGAGGNIVKNLELLFRMLTRGTGKHVRFCDIEANTNAPVPFAPFVPNPKWPREKIEKLLRDLAEEIFDVPVDVRTEAHTRWTVKMYAVPQGDCEDVPDVRTFDKVANVLFVPIGTEAGMKVYAHCHDWKKQRQAPAEITAR